ncbi:phytoene desaturase family protein [Nocardioides sp. Kera G14]|uniref:phytoene desaturase family protein n=1 Tax=Nocardioides sp. Kera G14 TaxID=2884264 RepID=UPI001D10791F|nr:FAD-dependent oxidoreductase [Nocardioides sp. Kera G14]UDY22502.1 FAD-dependent oxidoreductase [Nocardioides sp. Kera G14]
MARVVVVGGGFGGLASAARLAKLGHEVTVVSPDLGGALVPFEDAESPGFSWDVASSTLLPAVTRDLFRKSGRPLERELELEHVEVVREHHWRDGTVLRVRGASRAAQLEELGQAWVHHVESYADVWELTRQHLFESRSAELPREVDRMLRSREMLRSRLRGDFRDKRLREVAALPFEVAGHNVRDVPAWAGLTAYLEQRFGAWRPVGGMAALREVLIDRLETRRVSVVSAMATDVVVEGGRAVGVRTTEGDVDADVVVVAIDPRSLPALEPLTTSTMPVMPPTIVHLGLVGDLPEITTDVVLHGEPLVVVRPGGRAPDGATAWTLLVRGQILEDIDLVLWRHGIKIKPEQIVAEHRRSPAQLVGQWHGSPSGVVWGGRTTTFQRVGPRTPIPNVYAAGAASVSGDGLPFVGLSAALVAAAIGAA